MNIADLYLREKMSPREIGLAVGKSVSTVRRALLAEGVKMRSSREAGALYGSIISEKLRGRRRITPEMREKHHIDQNRQNNHIGNLQLMTRGEHTALHRKLEKEQQA